MGDGIRVGEVVVSDKIHVLDNPDTMVCVASAPKVEEEVVAAPVEGAVVTPAAGEPSLSVERGKKEDEEEE